MLKLRGIVKWFGGLKALDEVSFDLQPAQLKGLIGPNGAGKSTLLNIISRLYEPDGGQIEFLGQNLLSCPSYAVAKLGVGRVFQLVQFSSSIKAIEAVKLGAFSLMKSGIIKALLKVPSERRAEEEAHERAFRILEFIGLGSIAERPMDSLTLADQKRIELARALACQPKLILVDEPASGLNAFEAKELGRLFLEIKEDGVSLLIVEHNVPMILEIADEIVVLNYGCKIAEGTPAEIVEHEQVIEAYLGERYSRMR